MNALRISLITPAEIALPARGQNPTKNRELPLAINALRVTGGARSYRGLGCGCGMISISLPAKIGAEVGSPVGEPPCGSSVIA